MYLSRQNAIRAKNLSQHLLALNGWADQFTQVKKYLNKYSVTVDDYSINGIGLATKTPDLIRAIVNVLLVSYHLVNHLHIRPRDMVRVGFTGYTVGNRPMSPKIPRVYQRLFNATYTPPTPMSRASVVHELDQTARQVLDRQTERLGNRETALRFQLCIASEEAGELSKEISKYYRLALTHQDDALGTARDQIIDELFDTMYTIRYVLISANITAREINDFARLHIPHVWAAHVADKLHKEK
ncbi:hypothetical protein HDR63_01150 [bacterium]|nr:hypothetical protein [bacterium]